MLDKTAKRAAIGLNNKYLKVGQSAQNRLFGIPPIRRGPSLRSDDITPLQMLVSHQGKLHHGRLTVVVLGLFTLAIGIILSSIPWVDYLILKNLKLWNGTISYYYWQKPGVMRLTKVFVFNMTNPEGFLTQGQKPRLEEVGPFVYRENMEKVNVQFYDNGTVSFQHRKILEYVPELSIPKDIKLVVPNIPLLTLTSMAADLPSLLKMGLSIGLSTLYRMSVFNKLTPDELLFGFDETLTALAHRVYPKGRKPPSKMGLLLGRNATMLSDVATIFTGHAGMENFGLMERLNGLDHLPQWPKKPCNSIRASEGSLFPPRDMTGKDIVYVWDKDLCRIWPLRYRHPTVKDGIVSDTYTPDESMLDNALPENQCFCRGRTCPPYGFQDISPCQFEAPVYTSFPHFLGVKDKKILNAVEGLNPDPEKHETVFKIQPKLGVPLEARVRVQLNLKVTHANLPYVRNFTSMIFPIIWVEEGAEELPQHIHSWIYISTKVASIAAPIVNYGLIVLGATILILVFIKAYRKVVFTRENLELGKRTLRRGSSFLVNGQHRLLILRDSYSLLQNQGTAETSFDPEQEGSSDSV